MKDDREYSIEAYTPTDLGSDVTVYRARRDFATSIPIRGKWHTNKEAAARELYDMMMNGDYLAASDNTAAYHLGKLIKKYDWTANPDTDFDFLIKE